MSWENKEREVHTVHVLIRGRVQGVAYRAWTERTANGLGLHGWVRNRRDGTVEALFSGAAVQVQEMLAHCRKGPPAAMVTEVTIIGEGGLAPSGFEVLPTA
ncbi:MAG: acylphosphatase [Rhodomicrobium sp.]